MYIVAFIAGNFNQFAISLYQFNYVNIILSQISKGAICMSENQNVSEQLPSNAKLFSILSYVGILWLLGLLISPEKTSPFVRSHVNNGIIISIMECIPFVGWVCGIICAIMGIIAAAKTQYFTIPVIGDKIKIVK
jgi:uncharacterized membrane protein